MLKNTSRKLKAVDFLGIVLTLAGVTVLMLGLTWGGSEYPWDSAAVITTLVLGLVLCVAFVLWQWRGPRYPLVPRKLILSSDYLYLHVSNRRFSTYIQV